MNTTPSKHMYTLCCSPHKGSYPVLRTVPTSYVTRNEAKRLLGNASKILVATVSTVHSCVVIIILDTCCWLSMKRMNWCVLVSV